MPLPKPNEGESQDDFISRCMGNETMKADFPEQEQRSAVCFQQWRAAKGNSERELFEFKANLGEVRTEQYMGKDHLVVPVVALVEGVLHASNAEQPELALASEFVPTTPSWNGRPVVVNHPKKNGQLVSANSPDIWENEVIGFVFNAEAENEKLKMEAWIDTARAKEMGGVAKETVEALEAGDMLEVSTGLFAATEPRQGQMDGKKFNGVWRDILPDHLAILEKGAKGACSIEDGCGTPRMNSENCQCGGDCNCKTEGEEPEGKGLKSRVLRLFTNIFGNGKMNDLTTREALQQSLAAKGIDGFVLAVEEGGTFVHEQFSREEGFTQVRRSFDISGGRVNIGDDAVPVRQETTFTRVRTNEGTDMDKEALVKSLIDNEATPYTSEHKETLMGFEAEVLEKMQPAEAEETTPQEPVANSQSAEAAPVNFEKLLANADPETRESIEQGRAMFAQKKEDTINRILGCKRNRFTKEQLQAKSFQELESIAALVQDEADYSARGTARMNAEDPNAIPAPPPIFPINNEAKQ
jgi:hypothetical protein